MAFLLSCYLTVPEILTSESLVMFKGPVFCVLELLVLVGFLSPESRSQAALMENMLLAHVYCKRLGCVNIALRIVALISIVFINLGLT